MQYSDCVAKPAAAAAMEQDCAQNQYVLATSLLGVACLAVLSQLNHRSVISSLLFVLSLV